MNLSAIMLQRCTCEQYTLVLIYSFLPEIFIYIYIWKCVFHLISHRNYAVFLASHQNNMPPFSKKHFPLLLLVYKAWLYQYQYIPLSALGPAQLSVTLEEMSGEDIRGSWGFTKLDISSDRLCKIGFQQHMVNVNFKIENNT